MNHKVEQYIEIIEQSGFDWLKMDRLISHASNNMNGTLSYDQFNRIFRLLIVHGKLLLESEYKRYRDKLYEVGIMWGFVDVAFFDEVK